MNTPTENLLLVLISGKDFSSGADEFKEFEDSPLQTLVTQFVARYPDLPGPLCVTWHEGLSIGPFILGKKVVLVGHSFGGQRAHHQCFQAQAEGNEPDKLVMVTAEEVRYSYSDDVDPSIAIADDGWAQKIDRKPIPVANIVDNATAFLRADGQELWSYPQSSPIVVNNPTRKNVIVPSVDHNSILTAAEFLAAFWDACTAMFGETGLP